MHDWEQIRQQHGPIVWKTIARVLRDPDDVTDCYQDVFLEAYNRSQDATIHNMPGLLCWLAVRRALDLLRKSKTRLKIDQNVNTAELVCASSENAQRMSELLDCVRGELTSIPSEQAEAFWMCCVEGLKYREAAAAMALETQHVGVLVHRARQHLKQALVDWDCTRSL